MLLFVFFTFKLTFIKKKTVPITSITILLRWPFKIDYNACYNYFSFTFWILQLASDYLINFYDYWFIMTLYYKMRQMLLENATAVLLQNATEVYYKMLQGFYYKMRQIYDKMRQVLQAILLQNATVITKCNVYYKLRQCIPWDPPYSFSGETLIIWCLIIFVSF